MNKSGLLLVSKSREHKKLKSRLSQAIRSYSARIPHVFRWLQLLRCSIRWSRTSLRTVKRCLGCLLDTATTSERDPSLVALQSGRIFALDLSRCGLHSARYRSALSW